MFVGIMNAFGGFRRIGNGLSSKASLSLAAVAALGAHNADKSGAEDNLETTYLAGLSKLYDFSKARSVNSGPASNDVSCTVNSASPNTSLIDNEISDPYLRALEGLLNGKSASLDAAAVDSLENTTGISNVQKQLHSPVDVASINLNAFYLRQKRLERGFITLVDRETEQELLPEVLQNPQDNYFKLRSLCPSRIVEISKRNDVSTIDSEVCVILVSRGSHPAMVETATRTLESVVAADKAGFNFYVVSDNTPDDILKYLEDVFETSFPKKYSESSESTAEVPIFFIADRYGSQKARYLIPQNDTESIPVVETEQDGDITEISDLTEAQVDAIPLPTTISSTMQAVVEGTCRRHLQGEAEPRGDVFVTEVTADNWYDVVLDSTKDVVLDSYLTNCPMCMCLHPRMSMLAQLVKFTFPSPARETLRIASINVTENDRPHDWTPGPAFPTIQIFNSGKNVPHNKTMGPHAVCPVPQPKDGNSTHGYGHGERLAENYKPACVPSLSFTHPTVPGKMALPTLAELVEWIVAHSSNPFDIASVQVPTSIVLRSKEKFEHYLPPSPATETVDFSKDYVPLSALIADMDAEAKLIEIAIFESFYFEHLLSAIQNALKPTKSKSQIQEALANSMDSATSHVAVDTKAENGMGSSWTRIPTPDFGGLSIPESREIKDAVAELESALKDLKYISTVSACYGAGATAVEIMEKCHDIIERVPALRSIAQKWLHEERERKALVAAFTLSSALVKDVVHMQ